jgi:hypothetical protein
MGMTVEIEVGEIRNRLGRPIRGHLACPNEASEALSHLNVRQVSCMELVLSMLLISRIALDSARRLRHGYGKFTEGP